MITAGNISRRISSMRRVFILQKNLLLVAALCSVRKDTTFLVAATCQVDEGGRTGINLCKFFLIFIILKN